MMRDLHDCINKIKEEVDEIPLDDRPRVLVALPQPGGWARLKVGIIFKRSWLLSRLIRDHTDCFFLGAASRPFGPPALMPWAPSTPGRLGYN
jgi:hypothetical protein